MTLLPPFVLTFLGLIFCCGDIAALAFLLSWQERAPSPTTRRARMLQGVLPGAVVLLSLLLVAIVQMALLWQPA